MPTDPGSQPFVHLRLHTEFSIEDGLVTIQPLVQRVRESAMPAVAITDLANLFALIKFYGSASRAGIKPICGCDVEVRDAAGGAPTRLVLLAKDRVGYLNLTHLISGLYTDPHHRGEPVLEKSRLQGRSDGLIALSGGLAGDIGVALLADEGERAEVLLQDWRALFPDRFYLELQRIGKAGEETYIERALQLADAARCPVVATNDVRFLASEDFEAHEARVCIHDRRTLDDPRRPRNYTAEQYLKSTAQMQTLFADVPEALSNAWEIARRCNLDLEPVNPHLPDYPVPADSTSLEDYLSKVSEEGLQRRLGMVSDAPASTDPAHRCYFERLQTELAIINQMGFAGYFLIVMEFVQWARKNTIPVGPGRGSGAGSIVAWALGITDLDPLRYDLLFERFLNPERISMPDFDVDFCMEGRDRVIQHVAERYGKDAVSQIITFGTMAAKAVVRDVARVLGKPYVLGDKLAKLIPFEVGMTLDKALQQESRLREFLETDDDAARVMEMARKLEGLTRNVGKHAAGVVIAPTRLTDFTPLYTDESGTLLTQFDKDDVETAGLVKFDFLGLRTLTIIDWAVKMVNRQRKAGAPPVDINALPLDDEAVYRLLQRGETTAVFQLESRGMKDLIKRLEPGCFEDIIALVALFRPGPLQSGMATDFIDRKHGRTAVSYPHPELEPVLARTYGVILYQEQVMEIARVLANYTLGGADILRKAMGKKNPEEMAGQRAAFMRGAEARGIDRATATHIFDLMEKFAGYGFNKSHSAAYALVAYQTAWLKTRYPAFFMAAVMSADMQNTDKIVTFVDECRAMKLTIVPPDVNLGEFNFTVNTDGEIIYGLGAIKGLGRGPVDAMLEARRQHPFRDLMDLCLRVDSQSVNKRTLEALIRSGALDRLVAGTTDQARALLTTTLPAAMQAAEQQRHNEASGHDDMFGGLASPAPADSGGRGAAAAVRPWSEQERLAAEKEALGLYLSGHPIDEFLPELRKITGNRLGELRPDRAPQLLFGLVHSSRRMNRGGDGMAYVTLDDRSGRFELSLFDQEYARYHDLILHDQILVVECTVSVNDYTGATRGRVRRLLTLEQARRKFARRLQLHLETAALQPGFCTRLADLLEPCRKPTSQRTGTPREAPGQPGSNGGAQGNGARYTGCEVLVDFQCSSSRGKLVFGKEWLIEPSGELLQRLKTEYGKNRVVLDYQRVDTLE